MSVKRIFIPEPIVPVKMVLPEFPKSDNFSSNAFHYIIIPLKMAYYLFTSPVYPRREKTTRKLLTDASYSRKVSKICS